MTDETTREHSGAYRPRHSTTARRAATRRAITVAAVLAISVFTFSMAVAGRSDDEAKESLQKEPTLSTTTSSSALGASSAYPERQTTVASDPPGTSEAATPPSSPDADRVCIAAEAVAGWPLRQRLGQLLMVGVSSTDAREARSVADSYGIGGVFLGGPSGVDGAFTGGGLNDLRTNDGIPVAVAVDDEGGRVQRIDELVGSMPSARVMAATLTSAEVKQLALERGRALRSYGITVDFAPVVDVSSQPAKTVIGDRSFSSDPVKATEYAAAFAAGLRDAGVTPVLKHFPGHGRASGDSHRSAVTTPSLDELERVDLLPYRKLLSSDTWVMIGHLDVPGLTSPSEPASISRAVITGLLREKMGFNGVVVSDELAGMQAIAGRVSLPEAVRRHLAAGGDIALWSTGDELPAVLDHLVVAVGDGSLSEASVNASVLRVLSAKNFDPCA